MIKDYYKILNIERTAETLTIKKAYRKLALMYHPDKNKSPKAADSFIEITEAYEVLIDESSRNDYNYFFDKFFKSNEIKPYEEDLYKMKNNIWSKQGNDKANYYSKLNINEFLQLILKDALFHVEHVARIGCVSYLYIGTGIGGFMLTGIMLFDNNFKNNDSVGLVVIVMLVISVLLIYNGIAKTKTNIENYKSEYKGRR